MIRRLDVANLVTDGTDTLNLGSGSTRKENIHPRVWIENWARGKGCEDGVLACAWGLLPSIIIGATPSHWLRVSNLLGWT